MPKWLRPRPSIAENGLNIRRICVDSILSLKEVHRLGGWYYNHVPSLLWLAPKPIFCGGRMAEWLRPADCEVLTIKLRGIEPGQILITKKPTGEGGAIVTSPCNCGRRKPNFGVRMAEWLRPGLWEVLTIKLRGIEPGQVLINKKPTGESGAKVTSACNCGRRKPKKFFKGSGWPSS